MIFFLLIQQLVLTENSESLKIWQDTVVKPLLKLHVFNITNADAFLAGREKLHVEDVGPYIYE